MSINMSVGGRGRGNNLGKALGFHQILNCQILDPKGGTIEFMPCFIPYSSPTCILWIWYLIINLLLSAPPTLSFLSPQYLCFVLWALAILNPTNEIHSRALLIVSATWEFSAFLLPFRCSHLSFVVCCAFNSYSTLLNNLPGYLVLKYHKPIFPQNPRAWDSFSP